MALPVETDFEVQTEGKDFKEVPEEYPVSSRKKNKPSLEKVSSQMATKKKDKKI